MSDFGKFVHVVLWIACFIMFVLNIGKMNWNEAAQWFVILILALNSSLLLSRMYENQNH